MRPEPGAYQAGAKFRPRFAVAGPGYAVPGERGRRPAAEALAYEDAPTAEELEAAFRDWKEPEFCGITSFWWRAFGSLMACAAAGTVPEEELAGKAVRYLAGAGDPYSKSWTDDEAAAAREAFARGGEPPSHVFQADRTAEESLDLSFAALAVYGCDDAHALDGLIMEASGALNSAVIAEHASRLRTKPEVAARFLATYREALRHDERIMRIAGAWKAVQDKVDEIHARSEREAVIRDEDFALLTAVVAFGSARNALARGAFVATEGTQASLGGGLDPSASAG